MEYRQCLVLHKTQWDHLRKQAGQIQKSPEETHLDKKKEYLKALDEKSREWKKNWPDTTEGLVALLKKRKEKEHAKKVAFVEAFEEREKQKHIDNADALAEARQKIFNTSSDGRQLISTILESKAIEERQAQVKLKKFIQQKDLQRNKNLECQIASMTNNMYTFGIQHEEERLKRVIANKEVAKINKEMHEINLKAMAQRTEQEKLEELEDTRLMKTLLEREAHEKDHYKIQEKEDIAQHEADQREFKETRFKRDQTEDAVINVWQNHYDRVKQKEKRVWNKIITNRFESEHHDKNCKFIQDAQERSRKIYDDFVEKGIKELEKCQSQKEEEHMKRQHKTNRELLKMITDGKDAAQTKGLLKHCNKCLCDRQSLFTKPRKRIIKDVIGAADESEKQLFLTSNNKLSEELRKRKEEPTPWSGLKGTHAHFAQQASATLKECKYKHMTYKVIHNYKKVNCLDSTTLRIVE